MLDKINFEFSFSSTFSETKQKLQPSKDSLLTTDTHKLLGLEISKISKLEAQ